MEIAGLWQANWPSSKSQQILWIHVGKASLDLDEMTYFVTANVTLRTEV